MSWTRARIWRRVVVVLALVLSSVGAAASTAWAEGPNTHGHDISHPQCRGDFPDGSAFGIVGINQGRPFSVNPCLRSQYKWAVGRPSGAAVYVNTSNPAPSSAYYWPRSGSSDPALCVDSSSTTDAGCAYDYGWHAAANALTTGKRLGAGVTSHTWWLDVETTNNWNGDGPSNAAVLQGMYDYLRSHGVAKVGLYSTDYQWKRITGGYSASTEGNYRKTWAPRVTPDFPLHSAPLWIATAGSSSSAPAKCSTSFTGGPTEMVQFQKDGFDTNTKC